MPEPDARLQNAIERYGLASNEEWRTLLNHFDYQSGFAFVVILVPGPDGVAPCRADLERHLAKSGKRVLDISPATAEELKQIAGRLLDLQVEPEVGAVWMASATAEASPDFAEWAAAWREGVARLNQFRNLLQRQIPCTVVFVGATWVQPIIRTMAPDLWSVRSKVVNVRPLPLHFEPPSNWLPAPNRPADPNAPDPEFALQQAEALRGKPGQELTLARILFRAGQGWYEHQEFEKAIDAFQESASLQASFGASLQERAWTELALAGSLDWRSIPSESLAHYEEAVGLFHASGDRPGLATALRREGDLEVRFGSLDAARQHYVEAIRLSREERDMLSLAHTLASRGELEVRLGELDVARQHYDEAMRLFRDENDRLGLGSVLRSMGDLEARMGEFDAAHQHYAEAMSLFRDEHSHLNLGTALTRLGDLEDRLGEPDAARQHYEEAMHLFREGRDQLGLANVWAGLGDLASGLGQWSEARAAYEKALPLYREERVEMSLAHTLADLARVALAQGRSEDAPPLLAEAREAAQRSGLPGVVEYVEQASQQKTLAPE